MSQLQIFLVFRRVHKSAVSQLISPLLDKPGTYELPDTNFINNSLHCKKFNMYISLLS